MKAAYTGIHSSVPEEYTENPGVTLEYNPNRERVLLYLMSKSEWVTAWKINNELGLESQDKTFAIIRKLVKEINYYCDHNNLNFAIISNNRGFKYTTSKQEIIDNIDRLKTRMQGLIQSIAYQENILLRMKNSC